MIRVIAVMAMALIGGSSDAGAQRVFIVALEPRHGSVWLEGTFTLGRFRCSATNVTATVRTGASFLQRGSFDEILSALRGVEITVPVSGIRCGNARMERDLRNAIHAGRYGYIRYVFDTSQVTVSGAVPRTVRIDGALELAGATRTVRVEARVVNSPARTAATGAAEFLMSEFGVERPVAVGGLIRAGDRITIRFELQAGGPDSALGRPGALTFAGDTP